MDEDEVVCARELDGPLEEAVGSGRARRIVRVVEKQQVRTACDLGRDGLEVGHEAVLLRERQVVNIGAREQRP